MDDDTLHYRKHFKRLTRAIIELPPGHLQIILNALPPKLHHKLKQALADGSYYGDGGTIHQSPALNVGVSDDGTVEAVWFRCMMLPFNQYRSTGSGTGTGNPDSEIHGIELS